MGRSGIISDRIAAIAPSATLAITSRAKAMAAEGRNICSLAAGEPDSDTAASIKAAAAKALEGGETKYAPVAGLPALRKAIVVKLAEDNNLHYDVDQVLVSDGAKHSLFNIFMTLCREGDEVIVPSPYWLSYPEMIRIGGGIPVFVDGREEDDFKITAQQLEEAVTDRTKAVVINSPSNPIGSAYNGDELAALADVAVRHGFYIVADEIYEKIIYDDFEHVSLGSLSSEVFDRTITVNGFSKTYSMTGWRLGYFAGPVEIVKAAQALQSHSTSGANTFAQYGALEALSSGAADTSRMLAEFAKRRSYLHERLSGINGITCVKPMGAFYMFPNISSFGLGSIALAERLLEQEGVAVIPGAPFGADTNVRISYACAMETISEGIDRLERFVGSL